MFVFVNLYLRVSPTDVRREWEGEGETASNLRVRETHLPHVEPATENLGLFCTRADAPPTEPN